METPKRGNRYSSRAAVCVAVAAATLMAALASAADTAEQTQAKSILDATGVKGGLIVHVSAGDGKLTAALRANDSYLVEGLDADAKNIEAARKQIQSAGLYGKATAEQWTGAELPYVDNLVNLVVSENLGKVPMDEVMRVLAPNGVAYIKQAGQWQKTVKPRPKEIDEWTHYLHDPSNNAVAHDTVVGPPRRLQWIGSPLWSRHHDHIASMSALVSSNGRVFYIFDEGPTASIQLPSSWALIARDAFNGAILWKRPIPLWLTQLWPAKSGPAQIPRRLVAFGDVVYVTLGLDAPVTAIDAATGKDIRTYEGTNGTEEMIVSDGVLFAQITDTPTRENNFRLKFTYTWANTNFVNEEYAWKGEKRRLIAIEARTGKLLWKHEAPVAPETLAADAAHVYYFNGEKVICLNRANGAALWQSAPLSDAGAGAKRKGGSNVFVPTRFSPVLVAYKDVVLFTGSEAKLTCLSAKDGKLRWTSVHSRPPGPSPQSLLVANGLVWSGNIGSGGDEGVFTGRDPETGKTVTEFPPDTDIFWFHHRCYRPKATDKYLMPSRTGIEYVDVKAKSWDTNHWVRGGCLYGVMPANGLTYAPPHACGCYLESKLNGICALAPEAKPARPVKAATDEERLERGPAYEGISDSKSAIRNPQSPIENSDDWPTYRNDPARSGYTKAQVPANLKTVPLWQAAVGGGRLSSVVVAGGKLYVASIDTHTIHALDANTGKPAWDYTAGGRIDSPPTIYQERVLFGSADGWVYCLRATDGALAWRFHVAPDARRLVAFEQLESVWPVSGSVLVENGEVYCVAGRSMFLDGGLRMVRLDAKTGRKISETVMDDRLPGTKQNLQADVKGLNMPVALPDVLSCDGKYVYMRSQRFDLAGARQDIAPRDASDQVGEGTHLYCNIGFLDDSWFYRSYWTYGKSMANGWGGWYQAGRTTPAGRIMVFDASNVYSYGRKPEFYLNGSVLKYMLYGADKAVTADAISRVERSRRLLAAKSGAAADDEGDPVPQAKAAPKAQGKAAPKAQGKAAPKGKAKAEGKAGEKARGQNSDAADWAVRQSLPLEGQSAAKYHWIADNPPIQARAMVLADKTLFIAGPPNIADEEKAFKTPDDPKVRQALKDQAAALEGKKGASLWAVSTADGKKQAEYALPSPPVWDGMAAAKGRLYLATMDGKVLCMGAR